MKMPFGKHRGKELDEVPDSYLLWCLDKCDMASPTLKEQIRVKLKLATPPPPAALDDLRGKVRSVHRRMAMKYHPDKGGSQEAMAAINDMWEQLSEVLD